MATLLAAPVDAQMSQPTCLPGYTARQVPLPGSQGIRFLNGTMTWRCMADGTGSAPNIPSADPNLRSTVILSLAGPVKVNGCGAGHETQINIRATGGFFADEKSATAVARVSSSSLTNDQLLFEREAGAFFSNQLIVNVSEGDNVVPIRYEAGSAMNPGGKHTIRLGLVDDSLNMPITWMEGSTEYMQKYRIAPTGGIHVTFDLDGPGCG